MADELDAAAERIEFDTSVSVKAVCNKATKFDPGRPGECDLCGEEFPRVVDTVRHGVDIQACGGCRDKYGIP